MKINSNITAYITNNAYSQNEMRMGLSTAKLSSGYKLNTSGDDPANFAIASKMRSMIKGLEKVKVNTTTGTSVVQTAESAMVESQAMIQRLNELSIQAANGTNSANDRQAIQYEVDQLLKEIDRIAETTEFNGMKLLDGSFQDKGYIENVAYKNITVMDYSEETIAGKYQLNLTRSEDGYYTIANSTGTVIPGYKTATFLFGSVDSAKVKTSRETVAYDDGTAADYVTVRGLRGSEVRFKIEESKTVQDGNASIEISSSAKAALKVLTSNSIFTSSMDGNTKTITFNNMFKVGEYKLTDLGLGVDEDGVPKIEKTTVTYMLFGEEPEVRELDDGKVQIIGSNGAELTFADKDIFSDMTKLKDALDPDDEEAAEALEDIKLRIRYDAPMEITDLQVDLTGMGSMRLQVGTEQGEVINASIPLMTAEAMGIMNLDLTTEASATASITRVSNALEYVNRARSRMGAYENRLETTTEFIDAYNESLTGSLSRIQDTDMAEEMTEFTNTQILTQAGISMLAQANQAPQQALQLLQ
ncbi:MAG: hypothetical protein IJT96_01810 [Lachnospiraceae bacterium]|nr:hypothetical protein [Lachnospiraceae bacterium]